MLKKSILIIILIFFFAMSAYLFKLNLEMRAMLKQKEANKTEQMRTERKRIQKNFEEKYQADLVAYRAMKKRAEMENKKAEEAQNTAPGAAE